jgi:hypothetical protein
MRAPQKAAEKLATSKPLTIVEVSQNIKALIIRVNRPRVMILIGRVKIIIIGRIIAFTSPKINEVIRADQGEEK